MIKNSTKNIGQKGRFTEEDAIQLANQLLGCRNPYTCPKGKPTFFELPVRDFESRFRRKL
jgi:DNA mismatch repair ATPase MutL